MMLRKGFFERDVLVVARELVGTLLVWGECEGMVVETEAYAAEGDAAAHMAFRPSAREFMARHEAGAAYVYFNYGMYWLANVLVKGGSGVDGIILIRALEPVRGIEQMRARRGKERLRDLCSGPGKLAIAMGIGGESHGRSLVESSEACFKASGGGVEVEADRRIGISRAEHLRWRFLAKGNGYVSAARGKGGRRRAQKKPHRSKDAVRR
jgi:DNA-3-methyladenine glycosylase